MPATLTMRPPRGTPTPCRRTAIRRRIRPTIDIGDEEVDEAFARVLANKDKPQNLLAEIFLALDSPDKEPEVRAVAERLHTSTFVVADVTQTSVPSDWYEPSSFVSAYRVTVTPEMPASASLRMTRS